MNGINRLDQSSKELVQYRDRLRIGRKKRVSFLFSDAYEIEKEIVREENWLVGRSVRNFEPRETWKGVGECQLQISG